MRRIYHNYFQTLISYAINVLLIIFRIIPITPNKIVVDHFLGKGYGGNPKYLVEQLRAVNHYDIVWLSKGEKRDSFPEDIRVIPYGSLRAMFEMSTARVWIDDVRNARKPFKRRGQVYLQTWHGSVALKEVEREAWRKLSFDYVLNAVNDGKKTDGILAANTIQVEQFKKDFWLSDKTEILPFGLPRNDILFDELKSSAIKTKVQKIFDLDSTDRILLYAPTFRDDHSSHIYNLDFKKIKQVLEKKFNSKFHIIVKLHPNVNVNEVSIKFNKDVINGSFYPDIQELYIASDIMISDYSSAMLDYVLLKKPVFIFAPDFKNYQERRGLNPAFKQLPFPHAYTSEELINQICKYNQSQYWKLCDDFFEDGTVFDDGNASRRAVQWISKKMAL